MNFVTVYSHKVLCNPIVLQFRSWSTSLSVLRHSVNMVNGLVEVISKPEFLEVSVTDFYSHVSLINNIVSEDRLKVLVEFDNSSAEVNTSEMERFIDEKFG